MSVPTEHQTKGGERKALTRQPDGFGGRLEGAPKFEGSTRVEDPRVEILPPERRRNHATAWAELWAGWAAARGWPESERVARHAFEQACRHADASTILDAAQTWIDAYEAHNGGTRYLPKLGDWLSRRDFERAPPVRARCRERSRGGRVDLTALGFEMARRFEVEEARRRAS